MSALTVGSAAQALGLGLTPDTLRYYDRIGLVKPAARGAGGRRIYTESDLARLRFVQRAQVMNYSLREIRALLELRARPGRQRQQVRAVTRAKLAEIEARIESLSVLRNELSLLLQLCDGSAGDCPILDAFEADTRT